MILSLINLDSVLFIKYFVKPTIILLVEQKKKPNRNLVAPIKPLGYTKTKEILLLAIPNRFRDFCGVHEGVTPPLNSQKI